MTTKTITVVKANKETLFNAAKRATNQANLNNANVTLRSGAYTIPVKPFISDIKEVVKQLKVIAIKTELERLEKAIA